jgi:hypothetical protein
MTIFWWMLSALCWALVPVVGMVAAAPAAIFAITGAVWSVVNAVSDDGEDEDGEV